MNLIRDNGISLVGDHITAMVPIKNSKEMVEGIVCVQWQFDDLDAEKIFFLERIIVVTAVALLMSALTFSLR